MFQYFYLISLLLCIKLVISYEYLDDVPGRVFHSFGKNVRKVSTSAKRKDRSNSIHQEYDYDKNPVEFDVASFIQPDEETVADDETVRRRNQRRQRISKNNDYNSLFALNMEEGNSRNANQGYYDFGDTSAKLHPSLVNLGPPLLKDSLNIKKFKMSAVDESNSKYGHENFKNQIVLPGPNPAHNPQKKCILKDLNVPFLAHYNKSKAHIPKKTRKRKLFCFKCPKKNSKSKLNQNDIQVDSIMEDNKNKRSYEELLCPACRKKFITFFNDKHRKPWNKKLHNRLISEKYMGTRVKDISKGSLNNFTKFKSDEIGDDIVEIQRKKRQDPGLLMKKELDIIQQMIEHEDVPSKLKSTTVLQKTKYFVY